MTLSEIRNELMTFFQNKDTFSLNRDCSSIKVSKDQSSQKDDLIRLAFKFLIDTKIVSYCKTSTDELWILETPFQNQGQEITISFKTAEEVATLLNQFKEVLNGGKNLQPTDKLQITELDIVQLCALCRTLIEKEDKD